jgi:hypothetical protein
VLVLPEIMLSNPMVKSNVLLSGKFEVVDVNFLGSLVNKGIE